MDQLKKRLITDRNEERMRELGLVPGEDFQVSMNQNIEDRNRNISLFLFFFFFVTSKYEFVGKHLFRECFVVSSQKQGNSCPNSHLKTQVLNTRPA